MPLELGIVFADGDESVGVREREWLEQHRVDGGEHRRVGADRQRERDDRRAGDRAAVVKAAKGVAHVGDCLVDPSGAASVAVRLFHIL